MAKPSRLTDAGGVGGTELQQLSQGPRLQMGLVSEHNGLVGKVRLPARPLRRGLDGTEHAALGSRIDNPVLGGEAEAVQLQPQG